MAERKNILIILAIIVIALSAIVVAFGSAEIIKGFFVCLIFLIVFIFLPISLILNGWRYIKNGEWYIELPRPRMGIFTGEKLFAWIQLIMGVIALIVAIGGSLIVIIMTLLGR